MSKNSKNKLCGTIAGSQRKAAPGNPGTKVETAAGKGKKAPSVQQPENQSSESRAKVKEAEPVKKTKRAVSDAVKPESVSPAKSPKAKKSGKQFRIEGRVRSDSPLEFIEAAQEINAGYPDSLQGDLPEAKSEDPDAVSLDDLPIGKKDSLKRYIESISSYSRISVEDEIRLAKMIHSTDPGQKAEAIETLIQANLRLVVKIAHDFKGIGLPLPDLISEGNIGLMRSVEKFNPALGAKFSSYAAWWIKQSMHRALSNQTRLIRIPVQSGTKMRKIRKTRDALKLDLGREPEISEIARALNYSERTVSTLCHAENSVFSLNDPIKSDENDTFEELIADPNAKSPETLAGDRDSLFRVRQALKLLDPRERQVISLRFFHGKTLEEVSVMIRRTRERVRQIQNQALSRMRAVLADEAAVVNS